MSDTTKTSKRSSRTSGDDQTDLSEQDEANADKVRRDHFPEEPGDNQQKLDNTWETANPSGLSERDVKWPEVDSQEALDQKIDEAQTDKDDKMVEAAREADRKANDR
jgi:hypothetical protein